MKSILAVSFACAMLVTAVPKAQSQQANPVPSTDNTFYILPLGSNVVDLPEAEYRSECTRLWQQLGKGNDYHKVGHMQVINCVNFLRNVGINHEIGMPTGVIFDSQTHDHPDVAAVIKTDFRCAQWPMSAGATVTDPTLAVTMPIWLFSSNPVGSNSRYCRQVKVLLENNTTGQGIKVKNAMDLYPGTIVVLDGIIEEGSITGGDYCPYAVTEFRDWLRHRGMYDADTGKFNADAAPEATIGTWMMINGKMRSQFYDDPSPANSNGTGISFNQKFGTNFTSWTLRYWDLNAFNIPMTDQNTPMYPQSGTGFTAGGFDAPRVNDGSDYFKSWIWDLGTPGSPTYPPGNPTNPLFGFTQRATRNHVRDMFQILRNLGLPDNLMFAHQIPGDNAMGHLNTSPTWTGLLPFNGNVGITNFWTINPNFMTQYTNTYPNSKGWGIFEWHPFPSQNSGMTPAVHHLSQQLYDITLRDVTNYYNNGAHYLCIGWWWPADQSYWPSNMPQTGYDSSFPVNDSRTADALRDFLASRPNAPYPGYKGGNICMNAPSSLILNSISKTQINLQWVDNTTSETAYLIERKSPGKAYVQIASIVANATNYQDKAVSPGVKYTYRLRATQSNTCFSGYSNEATTVSFSDNDIVWNFTTTTENWAMSHSVTGTIENQTLHIAVTGSDPYIISANGLNINADQKKYVIINMKYDAVDQQGELRGSGTQNTDVLYPLNPLNTSFSDNLIDMTGVSTWTGTVNNMRIDPFTSASSGNLYFDWIRIVAGNGIDSAVIAPIAVNIDTSKYYMIYTKNSPSNFVTIIDTMARNGSNIGVAPNTNSDLQIWKIKNVGNGYYAFTSRSNPSIGFDCSAPPVDGTNVQAWTYGGNDRQQWSIQDAGDGFYHIAVMNSNPKYVLDMSGTNVQVWSNAGNDRQEWQFKPVTINTPPTISIASQTGQTLLSPASVIINTTASDADGSVAKVEFFNGTTKIGESTIAPFSFTWANVAAGSYTISAKATDNKGATTTSSVLTVTVLPTTIWDFSTTINNWNSTHSLTYNSPATIAITGADPYFYSPDNVNMSASNYKYIIIKMQNKTSDNSAQFYWNTTTSTGFSDTQMITFAIVPNDTIQRYYILDLSTNPNWTGTIRQIRFDPIAAASSGSVILNFIKFAGTYTATTATIPGIIEAENFDLGGQANAYNDADAINNGGQYRLNEGVDIEKCSDSGAGYDIGWNNTGEWQEFLVTVATAGTYNVAIRVAGVSAGQFHLECNGTNKSGAITVGNTGGVQVWTTVNATVTLSSGIQVMRVYFDNASGNININSMTFTKYVPTITPYISVNNALFTQTNVATLCEGGSVIFGPQPLIETGWKWNGPAGFTASTRQITLSNITTAIAGNYTATYTDANGNSNTVTFTVTVNGKPVIVPYMQINANWVSTSNGTFVSGDNLWFGPWPEVSNGWSWKGPNGFTSTARDPQLLNVQTLQQGTYTANYTDGNGCVGTKDFTITILQKQGIALTKGWNLISINVHPTDSSIATLFAGLDVKEIKTMNAFWLKVQNTVFNSLKTIQSGQGYMVNMNVAGTLNVVGNPIVETLSAASLHNGWNLVGCPYQSATPIATIFNTSNSKLVKNLDGYWIPNGTINSISSFEPNKAYFLKK